MNLSTKMLIIILIVFSSFALGHEGEKHNNQGMERSSNMKLEQQIITKINNEYQSNIKPIFRAKCFDCHSTYTEYPWYSDLPFAKGLIEDDIKEGLEHLDLSNDFPFGGHGKPEEDLRAIRKAVENDSMPPFRYWILNWSSDLSDNEKKLIKTWIFNSFKLIQQSKSKKEKNNE